MHEYFFPVRIIVIIRGIRVIRDVLIIRGSLQLVLEIKKQDTFDPLSGGACFNTGKFFIQVFLNIAFALF
jgi:hypothetical protein